jgi:hypothetical protein
MTWTTYPYCTPNDVQSMLGLQSTKDFAWIQTLIGVAQQAIDEYIGFSFQTDGTALAPSTRLYSGQGIEQLEIDYCIQIVTVTENTYNVITDGNGAYGLGPTQSLDITADAILGPPNESPQYYIKRKTGAPFYAGEQNYTITGVWGQPQIPPLINYACARLTSHYYQKRSFNYALQMSEQGGVRHKYTLPMPDDVREILDTFFRRRVFLTR